MGSIPGRGTKIAYAVWRSQKIFLKRQKKQKLVTVKGSRRVVRFFSVECGAPLLYSKDTPR